jgi:hypothetical protein
MTLNNADDIGMFFNVSDTGTGAVTIQSNISQDKLLSRDVLQCSRGSILIATRLRDAAFRLTNSYSRIIEVRPMEHARSIALLEKKLGDLYDPIHGPTLTNVLDHILLAFTQVVAYVQSVAPPTSVSHYFHDFEKSDKKRVRLLKYDGGDINRDREAANSILTTWQISFDHICRAKPQAADLLSLMSYFGWQSIHVSLLIFKDQKTDQQGDHQCGQSDIERQLENNSLLDSDEMLSWT